jgi:hypothetical protein
VRSAVSVVLVAALDCWVVVELAGTAEMVWQARRACRMPVLVVVTAPPVVLVAVAAPVGAVGC